jgi:adenosylcobinamide kinase/adenosylcobinamide-phosphate guanylyltransferase
VLVTADAELAAASGDRELLDRIARHRSDRPAGWNTVDAGADLPGAVGRTPVGTILIDCVTMWLSTLLPPEPDPGSGGERPTVETTDWMSAADAEIERLAAAVAARRAPTIVVSNEVGQGVVPASPAGRAFRDLQGRANQALAARCQRSFLVVAGLVVPLSDPSAPMEELR